MDKRQSAAPLLEADLLSQPPRAHQPQQPQAETLLPITKLPEPMERLQAQPSQHPLLPQEMLFLTTISSIPMEKPLN